MCSLSVENSVSGSMGNRQLPFSYTLTPGSDAAGTDPEDVHMIEWEKTDGTSGSFVSAAGCIFSFQLIHGETITFSGIPEGIDYVVSQSAQGAYTVTAEHASGSVTADIAAGFANCYDVAIPTGVCDDIFRMAYIMAAVLGTAVAIKKIA